jgi:hypothetical protein
MTEEWRTLPCAWLCVVAKPGRTVPEPVAQLARDSGSRSLPFSATRHLLQEDPGRRVLAAWAEVPAGRSPPWTTDSDRTTVLCGRWRRSGQRWSRPDDAAAAFERSVVTDGLDALLDHSVGGFTAVTLELDGATVCADQMGVGFVYVTETADVVAFASQAGLAARVRRPGGRPSKDVLAACSPVFAPYAIGERTGFEAVRLAREGVIATSRDRHIVLSPTCRPPWLTRRDERDEEPARLVERITDLIADELLAALGIPSDHHYVDLTGGRDSRLVLAVAMTAGLADRFVYQTAGPPHLRDVEIASRIATELGLPYRSGALWPLDDRPYADAARLFVRATAGGMNVWDMTLPHDGEPHVRMSGLTGECLRAHRPLRPVPASTDSFLPLLLKSFVGGSLDLLHPDARRLLEADVEAELACAGEGDVHPADAMGTFMVRNRHRRVRGPMEDLDGDVRIYPLCIAEAVRLAFALGPELRQDEYVHFEIMRNTDPCIATYPFAGPGFVDRFARQLEPYRDTSVSEPADGAPKAEALIATGHRDARPERTQFLVDAFGEGGNPVWELLDRDACVAAISRIDTLTTKQRRQLFGAATAALWCGEDS